MTSRPARPRARTLTPSGTRLRRRSARGVRIPLPAARVYRLGSAGGGARPMPRTVVWQHGQYRVIDDGHRARTNVLTTVEETLVLVPATIVQLISRALATRVRQCWGCLPSWFRLQVAVEDWWKGYRQLFPTLEHMAFNVAAVLHPTKRIWLYTVLRGLPFGLGAAVNQFNRVPALLSAAARRLLFILAAHYVDDNSVTELADLRGHGRQAFIELADMFGVALSEKKRQAPACMPVLLGLLNDLSRIATDAQVGVAPVPELRSEFLHEVSDCLAKSCLSPAQASHLRWGGHLARHGNWRSPVPGRFVRVVRPPVL